MEGYFLDMGVILPSYHKVYLNGLTTPQWPKFQWLDPAVPQLNTKGERCSWAWGCNLLGHLVVDCAALPTVSATGGRCSVAVMVWPCASTYAPAVHTLKHVPGCVRRCLHLLGPWRAQQHVRSRVLRQLRPAEGVPGGLTVGRRELRQPQHLHLQGSA